jgi:hypothetical protein
MKVKHAPAPRERVMAEPLTIVRPSLRLVMEIEANKPVVVAVVRGCTRLLAL